MCPFITHVDMGVFDERKSQKSIFHGFKNRIIKFLSNKIRTLIYILIIIFLKYLNIVRNLQHHLSLRLVNVPLEVEWIIIQKNLCNIVPGQSREWLSISF